MKESVRRTVPFILSAILALVFAVGIAAAECGDVNDDSYVNAKDVLAIKRSIVGINTYEGCDANGDGKVNAKDILAIKRHIVGIESLHDFETEEAITCEYGGYTYTYCTRCGYVDSAETVSAPGHDFAEGVCTRCGISEDDAILWIEVTGTTDRTYIIGEMPDFRDSVLTLHFGDGSTEDIPLTHSFGKENMYVPYHCQRLDDDILFISDSYMFTEPGTNTVRVNFDGVECDAEFVVEDAYIASLNIQNEDDGGLTIIASLSDGSVREMKLTDMDARAALENDSVSVIAGYMITDNGIFFGTLNMDYDTGEITVTLRGEDNGITSNAIEDFPWLTGYYYALSTYDYILYSSGDISCFDGVITKDNMDALIRIAVMRMGIDEWYDDSDTDDSLDEDGDASYDDTEDYWDYDEPTVSFDEETGDLLIPGTLVELSMWMTYGDAEFSLEDSAFYDADTDTYRMSTDIYGIYTILYPTYHTYTNDEWDISVSYIGIDESLTIINGTLTFSVNDMGQITRFDIGDHDFANGVCTRCGKIL